MNQDLIMFLLSATQPRRIRVIENTLLQRRTVSTLFWGMRYGITDFWGMLPRLNLKAFDQTLNQLLATGLVKRVDKSHYLLSAAGLAQVHKKQRDLVGPFKLPTNRYFDLIQFRQRFLLAVQVVSEFSYHNHRYYPMLIDHNDERFIKNWFHHFKQPTLVTQMTTALQSFLDSIDNQSAWQFTSMLNGHSITGMTIFQQAEQLNIDSSLLMINEWLMFNQLIIFLRHHYDQFESIAQLLNGTRRSLISRSAWQTYQLYKQRPKMDMIANYRRIKLSTVKEHLLEAAILLPVDQLNLTQFFSKTTLHQLDQLYQGNVDEWQFERIKTVQPDFDFFYFRMYQILRSRWNG
ncbi:helix-turn-helix domain-containing protein [Nicoliella lavandulae]|uniref:Helix-turn-helix domain-containing protein n=1 Tax=Nicoliella lavandulae TaxID=3082954 RepID=A0ABU8SL88_9LACO